MSNINLSTALCCIDSADLDELSQIVEAANQRRRILRDRQALEVTTTLTKGDKVRITTGIRPQYLVGLIATVTVTPPTYPGAKVELTFDDAISAGRFGHGVCRMPASCIAHA